MSDITWIKVTTDIFSNPKIRYIRKLPNGDLIALIWVILLTYAGRCNSNGLIFLTENIPYNTKTLSNEIGIDEKTVEQALFTFEELDMISHKNDLISITNWGIYQNVEGMEKVREQGRIRAQRYRDKQKNILDNDNVTSRYGNAIETDTEIDIDIDEEHSYQEIADSFNSICVSLKPIKTITKERKKAIKEILKSHPMSDLQSAFKKVEKSDFLKGVGRDWKASFDWLLKENNLVKVLEGNYDNTKKIKSKTNFEGRNYDFDELERIAMKG